MGGFLVNFNYFCRLVRSENYSLWVTSGVFADFVGKVTNNWRIIEYKKGKIYSHIGTFGDVFRHYPCRATPRSK